MEPASLPSIHKQKLFNQLQADGLLLTVNNRLAKRFTADYNQWQLSQDKTLWESPQIMPLSSWLQQQMENLSDQGHHQYHVLNASQEKQIWTDLIKPDAFEIYMMQPRAIARQVAQAWQLMHQWQIPYSALSAFDTPESNALLAWSEKFDTYCEKQQCISQTLLISQVARAIEKQQCKIPDSIIFAGFEDPNQLHQQLIDKLIVNNCQVSLFQHQTINQHIRPAVCTDFKHELEQAAFWAKKLLLQSTGEKIAVVIPSLNENRQAVESCFTKVLHPERTGPPPYQHGNLFNLTLGIPLSGYPIVHDALSVLKLLQASFSLKDLNQILTAFYLFKSPHKDEQQSQMANQIPLAKIDILLRHHGRQHWTLKTLVNFLTRHQSNSSGPDIYLQGILEQLLSLTDDISKQQSPQDWGRLFLASWKIFGWPGGRSLNSHEYQQSERLLKLLGEFRQLQQIKPVLTSGEAASIFKTMANDTIFQVQSEDAPVQISGLLEASDQQFDHMWMMGLDDNTLPGQMVANPFIPLPLQLQYNLPHCSAERELEYAGKIFNQFIQNNTDIVLSHPLREQDRELRPSPLLQALPRQMQISIEEKLAGNASGPNKNTALLQTYSDWNLPSLPEHKKVSGGAGVLTQQAQCPFMANASFRLRATEPENETDGISPLDRGNQLHDIMEKVWRQLQSSQQLKSITENELVQILQRVIDDVMTVYSYQRPDLYRKNFFTLEKQRLLKLVTSWLELEKQRGEDFKIHELEQDKTIEIGGLVLKTKADRIDVLDSGQYVILDYKTGKSASSSSWVKQQIIEPQLPLYSHAEQHELAAVALAKINSDQCRFDGRANDNNILPGIKAFTLPNNTEIEIDTTDEQGNDWDILIRHWQKRLPELAEAFRSGSAELNPDNCGYCSYSALCRKHELEQQRGGGSSI